ncbi:MAG: hypothetical protein ACK5YR_14465 [Pirellula sp.]|jgi:hypothetical protein
MRRMMHAITVPLLLSSFAVAQDLPGLPLQETPASVVAPEVAPPVVDVTPIYGQPKFGPAVGEQPYSPLATYMSCNDSCKDFWAGYSAERAAIAARLCKECKHGHRHDCQSCSTSCTTTDRGNGTNAGCEVPSNSSKAACNSIVTNRYRQSWASLHRDPDMMNNSITVQKSDRAIAKRELQKPFANDPKKSLMVSSQPTVPSKGSIAKESASVLNGPTEQPLISPYLKSSNAPQSMFTSTDGQQSALQTTRPIYLQGTLPSSDGKWAR